MSSLSILHIIKATSTNNAFHRGPTLEEIARIFDGDNAEVGIAHVKDHPELSNELHGEKRSLSVNAVEQRETISHKV